MNTNTTGVYNLELINNKHEIAYLYLPTYPVKGLSKVSKSFRLIDLIGNYDGPDVIFDFDTENILVGIEFLSKDWDEEE